MTGSTHFIAGSAIGRLSGNPILAAVLGFVFHYLMDLVPHWDLGYKFEKRKYHFARAALEPFIGVLIVVWILTQKDFSSAVMINIFVGGLFSLIPDIIGVFIKTFGIKKLAPLSKFHNSLHWFIKDKPDIFEWREIKISPRGIVIGILWQIPFIIIGLYILWI